MIGIPGGPARSARTEAWVLAIADRLRAGQPIEDRRVELKRAWIDPVKAARRIAGHANSARGDEILWVIGLDEGAKNPLVGARETEFSAWHAQVVSCFVEMSPTIENLNVPMDGVTLVGLTIDTSRAPYVVRNPAFGLPRGGVVDSEVPWREGTSIRSARRSDLLRVLVPTIASPTVQVLDGEVQLMNSDHPDQRQYALRMNLYLRLPLIERPLIFPDHDAEVILSVGEESVWLRECTLGDAHVRMPSIRGHEYSTGPAPLDTSQRGHGQLIVHASGPIRVLAQSWPGMGPSGEAEWASARISLLADGQDVPLVIDVDLSSKSLRHDSPVWTTLGC